MILTDYFRYPRDITWDFALQCGVTHGTIRLPEDAAFDVTDRQAWQKVYDDFISFGITPTVIEPMPNALHDHIKCGDEKRDECIEKVIGMLPIMDALDIRTICFNFMAHIGWLRTRSAYPERGGARVTAYDSKDFVPTGASITSDALWKNYAYFLNAVIPEAEKHGIKLALHPDDPPVPSLGSVSRIFCSYENIRHAIDDICPSPNLGVTMCQANFHIMGEDLFSVIPAFGKKMFFVHFRNTAGTPESFRETFHDNGDLPMGKLIRLYQKVCPDVPIRVDHVPTMAGENITHAGYDALGRLFAIGYLKGLIENV